MPGIIKNSYTIILNLDAFIYSLIIRTRISLYRYMDYINE